MVRGMPGTGKSWWLFLVMWEAAQRGVKVVLQHAVRQKRYLFDGSTVLQGSRNDFNQALTDPEAWYLVDGERPDDVEARTFAAVSPENKHYHKYAVIGDVAIRYMPIWTLEDLQKARRKVFPHLSENGVTELYAKWGGIPRYCLQYAEDKQQQEDLSAAVCGTTLSEFFSAVRALDFASAASHCILHWSVSPDLRFPTVVFASKYVARQVVHKLRKESGESLMQELIVWMDVQEMAAIAGAAFETVFHDMMQEGLTFDCRDLEDLKPNSNPKAAEMSVLFPPARLHVFLDKSEVSTVKKANYFVPALEDFEAVNSLMPDNSVFQATIVETHPVSSAGLEEALQLLPARDSYNLYFPVPEQRYKKFTKQALKINKGGGLQIMIKGARVKKVHQYALKVKM